VRLPRLLTGGAVVALLTGTAACGLQSVEPKIALRDAAAAFADANSGAVRLSIGSSADEVRDFITAADAESGATGENDIPDDALQTVLSASLDLGYDLGQDPKSDADDASRLVVHLGDLDAGELRYVDQTLYAQVDVDGLAAEFPEMQQGLDEYRAGLDSGDPELGAVPEEVSAPLTALLDGEWVSLDYQDYLKQMQELAAGMPDAPADLGLTDDASAKATELIGKALREAVVSVERRQADDFGDHLVAKISLRKAWEQLRTGLPKLFSGAMGEEMESSLPSVEDVPDKDVAVDFWVRNEALNRVELDLAQFLDEPAGHLVLRADMLDAAEITAPDGAVPFDLEGLFSGMPVGGVDGEGIWVDEGPSGADPYGLPTAHDVATWVDEDLRYTADDYGVPPSVGLLPEVLPYYMDVAPGLLIAAVGERIQVNLDGASACLALSGDVETEGNVVDTPC
jgi:hypothetical protein